MLGLKEYATIPSSYCVSLKGKGCWGQTTYTTKKDYNRTWELVKRRDAFLSVFFFFETVSLDRRWLCWNYVDQACLCFPSVRIKDMCHYTVIGQNMSLGNKYVNFDILELYLSFLVLFWFFLAQDLTLTQDDPELEATALSQLSKCCNCRSSPSYLDHLLFIFSLQHMCGCQRATCSNHFPPTLWAPETELRSLGLVAFASEPFRQPLSFSGC